MPEALICERHEEWTLSRFHRYSDIPLSQFFGPADFMPTINLSKFSDMTTNLSAQPYDTSATAEQPWVNSKFSLHDSDIEVRSGDGFIFQLHRVALGVSTGAFPGSEIDTGGEMVQLTEPANVLGILFAFLYPKTHPDLHGESFEMLAAIAEAAGKYEVISAVDICNERLLKFLPKHAPEILVHAVKHHYPRLISAILPHLARAPFIPVLEKLPPSYMVPWARYREAWTSVFKESALYSKNLSRTLNTSCHSGSYGTASDICNICLASLHILLAHLEEIDTVSTLLDTLRSPDSKYQKSVVRCCRDRSCPFMEAMTKLCVDNIEKIPSFTTLLGLKV